MAKKQAANKMSFEFDIDSDKAFDALQKDAEDHIEQNVDFAEWDADEKGEDNSSFDYQIDNDDEDDDNDDDNTSESDDIDDANSADANKNKAVKQVQQSDSQQQDENQEQQKVFGERANKRIRELNAQKKQAQLEADEIRKEKFEAEKQMLSTRKELLNLKVDKLKRDYEQAINDGEVSKQVELNAELAKIGADLSNLEQQESNYKEYKSQVRDTQSEESTSQDVFGIDFNQEQAAKLARDWEFDNPRVLTDSTFNKTSLEIGRRLMERGFRPDTEEFYTELTRRVRMAYGQQVDPLPEQTNKTTNEKQQQSEADTVVAKKSPPKMQTVAGASRTPSPTSLNGQATGKNVVRISREGLELAKEFGVDPRTYAKNYSRVEKAMNAKGQIKVDLFDE